MEPAREAVRNAPTQADDLARLGLDAKSLKVLARPDRAEVLVDTLALAQVVGVDRVAGTPAAQLLYALAVKAPVLGPYLAEVGEYVASGAIHTSFMLDSGEAYVNALRPGVEFSWDAFEAAAGVGVVITEEEVAALAAELCEQNREDITEDRYRYNTMKLMPGIKAHARVKFAEVPLVKRCLTEALAAMLGPRTAADDAPQEKKKKPKKPKAPKAAAAAPAAAAAAGAGAADEPEQTTEEILAEALVGRSMASAVNSPELVEQHKAVVGNKVRTRFPPEPNGYLHVGHAKAMLFNFEGSFKVLGVDPSRADVTLRYDDTNPDKESVEYIDNILENVRHMGWTPTRVTFSSDYFQELYDLALELIRRGKAYVCHQTKDEIEATRQQVRDGGENISSPWRNRSVEENLRLFDDMRKGRYAEGGATLRMKIDMTSPNPNMWDPIAYRIKYSPHPHVGDAWCIYPSYDYTHCIVDSLEHIDYSLCTLEFESRRESYYWLLEALDLYRPMVWEFSRLALTYTVTSKRLFMALIDSGNMRGWDDPRLPTLNGMRRRGYPPQALNDFCRGVGVTRNANVIQYEKLEAAVRQVVDPVCHRVMGVLRPLKIVLQNWAEDRVEVIQVADLPAVLLPEGATSTTHPCYFGKTMWIERSDFREEDERGFYGLAPGKEVNLKSAYNVTCTGLVRDPTSGEVTELHCTVDESKANKCKGHLHWVGCQTPGVEPRRVEVRLYEHLFTTDNPRPNKEANPMDYVNWNSEEVLTDCLVDGHVHGAENLSRFQFERVGYFVVDKDSTPERPVFNRIQALRSSYK